MGLGEKTTALALAERAMAVRPVEKDAGGVRFRSRSLPAWLRKPVNPIVRSPLWRSYSRYHMRARWLERAAHSCAAPARSNVRSAPERSAFSGIGRRKETLNPKKFSPNPLYVVLKGRASEKLNHYVSQLPSLAGEFLDASPRSIPYWTFGIRGFDPFDLRSGQAVERFFCEIRRQRTSYRRPRLDRESGFERADLDSRA